MAPRELVPPRLPSARPVPSLREHPAFSGYAREYDIAKLEFRALRDHYTRKTWDDREFILVGEVTKRLRQRSDSCQAGLENDLQRLLVTSHHSYNLPPPGLSLDELNKYLAVFYILIELECPQMIDLFSKQGLKDKQLPVNRAELLEKIKDDDVRSVPGFHARFLAQQYRWCPVTFDIGMGMHFNGRIIPICRREEIKPHKEDHFSSYRRSTLWKIDVPEALVSLALQKKVLVPQIGRRETDGNASEESKIKV
jgi:hypothetical protein